MCTAHERACMYTAYDPGRGGKEVVDSWPACSNQLPLSCSNQLPLSWAVWLDLVIVEQQCTLTLRDTIAKAVHSSSQF